MRDSSRRALLGISVSLVVLCGCHQGDAITEPQFRTSTATPTPVPSLQLAGTWTAYAGAPGGSGPESFTVTIVQNGTAIRAEWVSPLYGSSQFNGGLIRGELLGHVLVAHAAANGCSINGAEVKGPATASRIELSGFALCRFDPWRYSAVLTR